MEEEEDLADWLESELEPDEGVIKVPAGLALPAKIRWIASDGANVIVNQVLAAFSPVTVIDAQNHTDYSNKNNRRANENGDDKNDERDGGMDMTDFSVPEGDTDQETKEALDSRSQSRGTGTNKDNRNDTTEYGRGAKEDIAGHQGTGEKRTDNAFILRSAKHGTLKQAIANDTVINDNGLVIGTIDCATCSHSVVVHGLCVECCQVVEQPVTKRVANVPTSHSKKHAASNNQQPASGMVVPGFITSDSAVQVDASVANEMELMEILGLLRRRKLCLVLDLDNTLIHSSMAKAPDDIDIPLIDMYAHSNGYKLLFDNEEKMRLYEKELERSILITRTRDDTNGRFFVNYYKLRPGVYQFLREASEMYDLYLFTMGTRSHAQAALRILDPTGALFGNRIFSRYEANNNFKSLCRIFPTYTNLLLILDDSEHVWIGSPGLIKVHPYYYFTEKSLIRSRDYRSLGRVSAALQAQCNYSNYIWHSVIMDIWKGNDYSEKASLDDDGFTIPLNFQPRRTRRATFKYNSLLMANERPSSMLDSPTDHAEKGDLENSNEQKEPTNSKSDTGATPVTVCPVNSQSASVDDISIKCEKLDIPLPNSSVLMRQIRKIRIQDCDSQLLYVTRLLKEMYSQFYNDLDTTNMNLQDLRKLLELGSLPDVGALLSKHRNKILKGVVLSVNKNDFRCPLTGDELDFLSQSDLGVTACRFGVSPALQHNQATHYLKNNISDVAPKAGVKKVHSQWLEACIYTWSHVDESLFDSDKWNEPIRSFWDALHPNSP